MMLGLHQMPLEQTTQSLVNVAAGSDISPPVLSPSAPLAALFGISAAEESPGMPGCSPALGEAWGSQPLQPSRPVEALAPPPRPQPQLPSWQRNCNKCKLGKGKCRRWNQPGHLWKKDAQPSQSETSASEEPAAGSAFQASHDSDSTTDQDDLARKSGRERKKVVMAEAPGTSGEPQLASKPIPAVAHVSCVTCKTWYSNIDLSMPAAAVEQLNDWKCGVCAGTHVSTSDHWRHSETYSQNGFRDFKPIVGEQWSESEPVVFVPEEPAVYMQQDDNPSAATNSGSWSVLEDDQLRRMCEAEGPGDWVGKASRLTAGEGRSASSLRQRWAKLQSVSSAGASASTKVTFTMPKTEPAFEPPESSSAGTIPSGTPWSTAEDEQLRGMVKAEGPGDWIGKATRFTASEGRTASALRKRWAKLQVANGGSAPNPKPAANKPAASSVPKALPKKRAREEPTGGAVLTAEKNCKLCRIGRGQCRHWNRPGHLQSGLPAPAKAAPRAPAAAPSSSSSEEEEEEESDSGSETEGAPRCQAWSEAEDRELKRMCAKEGEGDWVAKAAKFKAGDGRSASSLRQRWKLLHQG